MVLVALLSSCCYAIESRTDPSAINGRLQKQPTKPDPSCGGTDELAAKVAVCAKPLMNLLKGEVEKWPRTEEDAMQLCDSVSLMSQIIAAFLSKLISFH